MLVACAATFASERRSQFGLAYLRLRLRLDPKRDDAWLLVGDLLDPGRRPCGRARGLRQGAGHLVPLCRGPVKLAWSYQTAGDKERAVVLAQQSAAAAPKEPRRPDHLCRPAAGQRERWAESAAALDPLIAGEGDKPDWRLLLHARHRPGAGRALGRRRARRPADGGQAQPRRARPAELSRLFVDRSRRAPARGDRHGPEGRRRPSAVGRDARLLGWGYYRQGDFKTAVTKLEQAVELEPGDPDVNGHLGDAYWRIGRQVEARYQWQRVLSLEPDAKQKAEAEAKLKDGLDRSAGQDRLQPVVAGRVRRFQTFQGHAMRLDAFAPAKVNLFLHVGGPDAGGLSPDLQPDAVRRRRRPRPAAGASRRASFETTRARSAARFRWATATWWCGPPTPCALGWADRSRRSA